MTDLNAQYPTSQTPFESSHTSPHYLTHDTPGIKGSLKNRPEDFLVEEIPLYDPKGEGEHIYLLVEKRSMTTMQVRDALAKHFNVQRHHVGYAGLKDKDAITRQVFSIHTPGKSPEDFPSFQHERASILWADLHTNKLKRAHLSGNRFSIKVRDVNPLDVRNAKTALDQLAQSGVPNRFGPQRFGTLQNNHLVGRALILDNPQEVLDLILSPNPLAHSDSELARQAYIDGRFQNGFELMPKVYKIESKLLKALSKDQSPEQAIKVIDQTSAGFFISAFQSAIFNQTLNQRILNNSLDTLLDGDLAIVTKNKSIFPITDTELNDQDSDLHTRCASFSIGPSGPMWGTSMTHALGNTLANELQTLISNGVTEQSLIDCELKYKYPMIGGERRMLRMELKDPEVEGGMDEHGAFIRCGFELPSGGFATTVMDEIMKLDH